MPPRSYTQLRQLLPPELYQRWLAQYPGSTVEEMLRALDTPLPPTIRVNTLVWTIQAFKDWCQKQSVKITSVPGLAEVWMAPATTSAWWEKTSPYQQGQIYLQGSASALPAVFLRPRPGQQVIDLAAAPGSKTTQIAAYMQNQGTLWANELNTLRREKLQFNLRRQCVTIAQVREGSALGLEHEFGPIFDRVLLDAPCSAEGRIRFKEPRTYLGWKLKNITDHAKLQKKLIQTAFQLLAPQGFMVYSTCTLAPEENEAVVHELLHNYGPRAALQPLTWPGLKTLPIQFQWGTQTFSPELAKTLKAAPTTTHEGFFIALIQKIS